jgi:hypothetical protein
MRDVEDLDWTRLIVVTAVHGEKCLGFLPEDVGDPKKYVEDRAGQKLPITVHEARNMLGQATPGFDKEGRLIGVRTLTMLLPIDMLTGPMPEHNIIPSSWYFPGDHAHVKEKVTLLIHQAVELETRMAAEAANIRIPDVRVVQ